MPLQQNPANSSRGCRAFGDARIYSREGGEKFWGNRAVLAWLDSPVHQSGMPGARTLAARGSGPFGAMQQLRRAVASRAAAAGAAVAHASANAGVLPAVAASLSSGNQGLVAQAGATRIARRRKVPAAHTQIKQKPAGNRGLLNSWVEKKERPVLWAGRSVLCNTGGNRNNSGGWGRAETWAARLNPAVRKFPAINPRVGGRAYS